MPPCALVKPPSVAFARGLTSQTTAAPDLQLARSQHAAYRAALESLGFRLIVLAEDGHPDSCFVEDMAVVLPPLRGGQGLLLGARSPVRSAEQPPVLEALRTALPDFRQACLEEPAFLDGGDVLRMDDRLFVGLSRRTNREGYEQFRALVEPLGYEAVTLNVDGMLHLKTGVSRLNEQTVLVLPQLADAFFGLGYRTVLVDPRDWHAANIIAVEGRALLPAGHDRVSESLRDAGFEPLEVELSEYRKQDGGATCLSVLLP